MKYRIHDPKDLRDRRFREVNLADNARRPDSNREIGTLRDQHVKHVVVLMMENHSYDNYLGTHPRNKVGDGLTTDPDSGRPLNTNLNKHGIPVAMFHRPNTDQSLGVPTQAWHASHEQVKNACSGFVTSTEDVEPDADSAVPMSYWDRTDLPFYHGLADVFPLCTRWHCSCLGPTFPNRRFLMAATAHGLIDDLPFAMIDYPEAGTIFDLLDAYGITWKNYHVRPRWRILMTHSLGIQILTAARKLAMVVGSVFPKLKEYAKGRLLCTASIYPLHFLRARDHLANIEQFDRDAKEGTLPAFSIVDPDFGWCSEENPQNIQDGESFAAYVVNAVMNGEGWRDTVLIWLYDEHGGYYDHIVPPAGEEYDPGDGVKARFLMGKGSVLHPLEETKLGKKYFEADEGVRNYRQLGFRVPAVVVSPWAKKDCVCQTTFDHTSILRFVEDLWNLPPLTERDLSARSIDECLDFSGTAPFLTPPKLPSAAKRWNPAERKE